MKALLRHKGALAFLGLILLVAGLGISRFGQTAPAADVSLGGPPLGGRFGEQLHLIADPKPLPPFTFRERTAKGDREIGFVELEGKALVVTFWATWCPVCAREMPKLERLQKELGDENVLVVALSQDDAETDVVARYLKKAGLSGLRLFHDNQRVFASVMGVTGVPTSLVIDARGRAVGAVEGGADWDSDEAMAFLRFYAKQG